MPPTALHPRQPRGPTLRTNEPASPAIAGRDSRSGTVDAVRVTPLARPDPVEDLGAIQLRFAAMGDDYQESSGENG